MACSHFISNHFICTHRPILHYIHSLRLRVLYVIYMLRDNTEFFCFKTWNWVNDVKWLFGVVLFNFVVSSFFYQSLIDGLTMSSRFDTLHSFNFYYLYNVLTYCSNWWTLTLMDTPNSSFLEKLFSKLLYFLLL